MLYTEIINNYPSFIFNCSIICHYSLTIAFYNSRNLLCVWICKGSQFALYQLILEVKWFVLFGIGDVVALTYYCNLMFFYILHLLFSYQIGLMSNAHTVVFSCIHVYLRSLMAFKDRGLLFRPPHRIGQFTSEQATHLTNTMRPLRIKIWSQVKSSQVAFNNKKLSYRRETARQLPTWRGLDPPAHSPPPTYAYGRIRNPQQTYVKRGIH